MNSTLKMAMVTMLGCNKHVLSAVEGRSALHHNIRRNARRLLRSTALILSGLMAAPPTHAEQLGRLFFTPQQRAQFDYNYSRETRQDINEYGLMLNGIVQKHGGKSTAWINGVPQSVAGGDELNPESMPVTLPGQSKPIKLKVGQRALQNPSTMQSTLKPDMSKQDTRQP